MADGSQSRAGRVRTYIPSLAVGTGITALAGYVGLGLMDKIAAFNEDAIRMDVSYGKLSALAAVSLFCGAVTGKHVPKIASRVKKKLEERLDDWVPAADEDGANPRNRVFKAGCLSLALIAGASYLGSKVDIPYTKPVLSVAKSLRDSASTFDAKVSRQRELLVRYGIANGNGYGYGSSMAKFRDFMTDLPPDDLVKFKDWFSKKYCKDDIVPDGLCGEVWQFTGIHKGHPVYLGFSYLYQSGLFTCYRGMTTYHQDIGNNELVSKLTGSISIGSMVQGKPKSFIIGAPDVHIVGHADGWECRRGDTAFFFGRNNNYLEGSKLRYVSAHQFQNAWTITKSEIPSTRKDVKITGDLPANWWELAEKAPKVK